MRAKLFKMEFEIKKYNRNNYKKFVNFIKLIIKHNMQFHTLFLNLLKIFRYYQPQVQAHNV